TREGKPWPVVASESQSPCREQCGLLVAMCCGLSKRCVEIRLCCLCVFGAVEMLGAQDRVAPVEPARSARVQLASLRARQRGINAFVDQCMRERALVAVDAHEGLREIRVPQGATEQMRECRQRKALS